VGTVDVGLATEPIRSSDLDTEVRQRVLAEIRTTLPEEAVLAPSAEDEGRILSLIRSRVDEHSRSELLAGRAPLGEEERGAVTKRVFDHLLRLGPFQEYLDSDGVEEVMCNGPHIAFVVEDGRKVCVDPGLSTDEELRTLVTRTVARLGRRLDDASPAVDCRLPDGSRLHAVIPPLAPFTCLTIRRFQLKAEGLSDLVALETLTPEAARFLEGAVRSGANLLVSGGTAAGKTTTLNALGTCIPAEERVVTIEETGELQLHRTLPDCIPLESRFANVEGLGKVRIRDLVRHALRMRPTRVIVGEVRGSEALDMLAAMNSGHDGSMGTIHANGPRQALSKLRTYVMMAEEALPAAVVTEMIADTLDLVVHLRLERRTGRRVVSSVFEVTGLEGGVILGNELLRWEDGRLASTGVPSRRMARGDRSAMAP
jgi:pilus assembly protein CpaF